MRNETEAAIRAVTAAQRIADSREGADEITSKGGIDLVTGTDIACEDSVRAELLRSFPDYAVIGEERGGMPAAGKPYWLVDPICGTRPFASNIPLYCTNLALVEDGAVTMAVVGIGKTGEVLFAEKGSGTRMRTVSGDQPVTVSDRSNTIWIDGSADRIAEVARRALSLRRWYVYMFASTVSYAYLASGRIAGLVHLGSPEKARTPSAPLAKSVIAQGSVHTAAGTFLAAEAGAFVIDLATGNPWNLETRAVVIAASSDLQRELTSLCL